MKSNFVFHGGIRSAEDKRRPGPRFAPPLRELGWDGGVLGKVEMKLSPVGVVSELGIEKYGGRMSRKFHRTSRAAALFVLAVGVSPRVKW